MQTDPLAAEWEDSGQMSTSVLQIKDPGFKSSHPVSSHLDSRHCSIRTCYQPVRPCSLDSQPFPSHASAPHTVWDKSGSFLMLMWKGDRRQISSAVCGKSYVRPLSLRLN